MSCLLDVADLEKDQTMVILKVDEGVEGPGGALVELVPEQLSP